MLQETPYMTCRALSIRRMSWKMLLSLAAMLAAWLAMTGEASAADCSFQGPGSDWHASANWSCSKVPDAGDSVTIAANRSVTVSAAASAASLSLAGGTITFAANPTLAVAGIMSSTGGNVEGNGTVTVDGSFSKTTDGLLSVKNSGAFGSPDLILNQDATLDGGSICVADSSDADPDLPNLHINRTFTIGADAAQSAFSCGSAGTPIHVNAPNGHLVKAGAGLTFSQTAIDNDDTITVQAGQLLLTGGSGNAGGATSAGAYLAEAGATLVFQGSPPVIGSSGRVGGPGTVHVQSLDVVLAAGAVLDPAVLQISGNLVVNGSSALALPDVRLTGGTLDNKRPLTVTALSVTAGTLQGDSVLTVPAAGSFSKTTDGLLNVKNSGAQGSTDLILNVDATLEGSICVARNGDQDPDQPNLHINRTFTIGAGAAAAAFACGSSTANIHVNAPDGHLVKTGTGTTTIHTLTEVAGTVTVDGGQTLNFVTGYQQTGGLTDIASGGILQAAPSLSGGVLRGSGQVSGTLTNNGGTVRPGTSPGTLTVTGDYSQGAGGTLETEIEGTTPGTQFDRLAVGGAATLGGTLAIVNAPSFTPALTDTFKILTASSRSGQFASLTGTQAGGRSYSARYDADGVTLLLQESTPSNTGRPSIPPSPAVGETISCNPGTWTGTPSFAFEWLRDGQPIAGADAQTYTVTGADVGHDLVCRVAATNSAGTATEDSNIARATAPTSTPTPTPSPAPTPTATPSPAPAQPALPVQATSPRSIPIQQIASLPSARRCVSRRKFRIRLRSPRGEKLAGAEVYVNGKRIRVIKGKRLSAPVDLRGLPKGRFKVEIRITTISGKRFTATRRYRTCTPKPRAGR